MNYEDKRPTCVSDTECFPNYWAIAFRCVESGRTKLFDMFEGQDLDRQSIANILRKWRIVGFNLMKYDLPMIALAMTDGVTTTQLKRANDDIILGGLTPWKFYEKYDATLPNFVDYIDLMEVNPGAPTKPSLKICGGRLHTKRMQDLPFEPDRLLTQSEIQVVRKYLGNDLALTLDLHDELVPQIELRQRLSNRYGMDLRSKSDPQLAEAIIKAEAEAIVGRKLYRPDIMPGVFYYKAPPWIEFQTPYMQEILSEVVKTPITIDSAGVVQMPKYLSDKKITIGEGVYRMGIGGLHSTEESVTNLSDDEVQLIDSDVGSMYPNIILTTGLAPKNMGKAFTQVYRGIVEGRMAAKARAGVLKKEIAALEKQIALLEAAND